MGSALMLAVASTTTVAALPQTETLQLRGRPGRAYVIEASEDLQRWTTIKTNQADAVGRVLFNDPLAGSFAQRFYRGRLVTRSLLGVQYRRDRVLIKPKAGITLANVSALNATLGVTSLHTFPRLENLQIVRPPANLTASTLVERYRQSGLVQYAEHDYLVRAQLQPNDVHFQDGSLWNLHNTGQNGGVNDADLDAPEAWDSITSAANIIVAVTDTGIRYTHEDLAPNMWVNPGEIAGNNVDDDANGFVDDVHGMNTLNNSGNPDDDYGHGTHVAGTIGAMGNNQLGIAGICWRVQLMALKFIDSDGQGSVSDAIRCIDYARSKGAHVINASWGDPSFTSQALQDAIASARDADIIFAAAAGNGGEDGSGDDNDVVPLYPASYDLDNIIAVAATTRTDDLPSFSNFGATTVDLAAPGSPIGSCWNGSDSDYQYFDGTSMAAAHVSGVAALVRAFYPNENYRQIINRILAGVDPLPGLAGKCTTGGRLNAQKALGTTPPTPPVVTVTASDAAAAETGDPGAFTVTRTGSTAAAVAVSYTLAGTAGNGTDYQSLSGTVSVPAGAISTTITVTPIADSATEASETVVLTLTANSSYTVGSPGSATVTIVDQGQPPEEPVISLSAFDSTASETGPDDGVIIFHRTGDTAQPIQVNWTFSGTAVNGSDFEELPTTSPFPVGLSEAPLIITPIDDSLVEGSETAVVTLVDGPGYSVGSPNTATITITDNDEGPPPLPTVTVTASDASAAEPSNTGTFTVSRTGSTAAALTVNYSMNGSAQNGTDYQTLAGTVTVTAGSSSATITLTPINDSAVEGNETAVLNLSASSAYTVGSPSSATVTIADDDQPPPLPTVTVTASDASAAEPSNTGTFTVSRTGSTAAALTVNYSMNGSAQNGTDYQTLVGTVTFAASASSANVTLTPINDSAVENSETAVLTLSASSAYTIGSPGSATVTIADNDQPPPLPTVTVTASDANAAEPSNTGTFTVSRTGSTAAALTVNYSMNGSAQNGTDYQTLSGSVTIATGASSANVTVTPINDSTDENNETVILTLAANSAYTVGSPSSATVTIADNDEPPPPLVADFTASPLLGLVPLIVNFTDTSTGNPNSWSWNFGDGTTSNSRHPSHIYLIPGDYTVTLTVRNSAGASSSKSVVIRASLLTLPLATATETREQAPITDDVVTRE